MRTWILLGLLSVGNLPAVAGPAASVDTAQYHFHAGQAAYDQGRYREAALEFDAAYALQALPALLFNQAQAWRHEFELHSDRDAARRAIDAYRRYLAAPQVNDADRREAGDRLAALSALLLDGSSTTVITKPPAQPLAKRTVLWIGVGAGVGVVVILALGLGLGLGLQGSDSPTIKARF